MPKLRCLVALIVVSSACAGRDDGKPAELVEGDTVKVVGIVKGDELEVEKGGKKARVRLVGVQAFSAVVNDPQVEALAAGGISATSDLVKDKTVSVAMHTPPLDPNGRYLSYVSIDGVDVNKKLIQEGWAVTYTEFPFAREADYLAVETPVRLAERNIWGLKPAAELVRGLRKQWAEARATSGRPPANDPLLQ